LPSLSPTAASKLEAVVGKGRVGDDIRGYGAIKAGKRGYQHVALKAPTALSYNSKANARFAQKEGQIRRRQPGAGSPEVARSVNVGGLLPRYNEKAGSFLSDSTRRHDDGRAGPGLHLRSPLEAAATQPSQSRCPNSILVPQQPKMASLSPPEG